MLAEKVDSKPALCAESLEFDRKEEQLILSKVIRAVFDESSENYPYTCLILTLGWKDIVGCSVSLLSLVNFEIALQTYVIG